MPVPSPFHPRTHALCGSLNYREWAGYYAVSAYEAHHEHEYAAIRTSAALFDISPLFKYRVSGPGAMRLVDRVITRDATRIEPGQVVYTPWCDARGRVIDDGTVARIDETTWRWTAADPSLRWIRQNADGLDIAVEDVSESVASLAVQGPTSADVLGAASDIDVGRLRYFRVASGQLGGVAVDVSRTGYTGDLGFEVWMPRERALDVWDAVITAGRSYGLRPAGMLALDVARIEAGLLLIDVDFMSCRKALTDGQCYTPFEMGLGRLVSLDKAPFVGRDALRKAAREGAPRQIVGLEIDWTDLEARHAEHGLPPEVPAMASRVPVPVYRGGRQVGRATSTTWSPLLKKMIALATVEAASVVPGTALEFEWTVEAVRHRVGARVVPTPFYNPRRKTQGSKEQGASS